MVHPAEFGHSRLPFACPVRLVIKEVHAYRLAWEDDDRSGFCARLLKNKYQESHKVELLPDRSVTSSPFLFLEFSFEMKKWRKSRRVVRKGVFDKSLNFR